MRPKAVYFRIADLMNADVYLIVYDTTSLHFDEEDEIVRKRDREYEPLRKRCTRRMGATMPRRSWWVSRWRAMGCRFALGLLR